MRDSTATKMGSPQKKDAWGSSATLGGKGGSPQSLCPGGLISQAGLSGEGRWVPAVPGERGCRD